MGSATDGKKMFSLMFWPKFALKHHKYLPWKLGVSFCKFFNYTWHVSGEQHSDYTFIWFTKWSPRPYLKYPPDITHSYYNVIDFIPYAIFYIPWLFCNWQFVLKLFTFFSQPPKPVPVWQTSGYSMYLWLYFYFICLFILFCFIFYI